MRWMVVLVLLLGAGSLGGQNQPLLKKTPIDRSVDRALAFLANTQNTTDGSWNAGRQGKSIAITSLAVMAFLSAGHVPGEGPYGKALEKGVRWVLDKQQPNGLIAADNSLEMYSHGIATLMLAEVAGMVDRDLGKQVRIAVERAVPIILKAQRKSGDNDAGGWRYQLAHLRGSDMSVTGWQIMALRAAKNIGCDVPSTTMDRAITYVKRCQNGQSGGFHYMPFAEVTAACTGTGVLALELCGKDEHRSRAVLAGANYLIKRDQFPSWGDRHFFYTIYYGSQATFQVGGNYWNAYRSRMHELLLRYQSSTGSWIGGLTDAQYGANYCTSLAVLALTVEYRFLPIYQSGESEK